MIYIGKNKEIYGDLEETILACLLIEPTLMEQLIVEEKHFKKFGYILTFFKEFYAKHRNLDISLMLSIVKSSSEMTLMDLITYLLDLVVIPPNFADYQKQLIAQYNQSKKEDWLKKKIYEKATKLLMGSITIKQFNFELKKLYDQAEKIDWR
jgi:hypothetical protein